ncbi:MAG: sialidase family protein [Planctomycetota bacterium]|jgi:hypothetical protein
MTKNTLSIALFVSLLSWCAFGSTNNNRASSEIRKEMMDITIGGKVVKQIPCRRIPLEGSSHDFRAEAHTFRTKNGDIWSLIPQFGLLYNSKDGGKNWTTKKVDFLKKDHRTFPCFTILQDDTFLAQKIKDNWKTDIHSRSNIGRTPAEFHRSTNYGDTWQLCSTISADPYESICEGTQSLNQLKDGTILFPVLRWTGDVYIPGALKENVIYRSYGGGKTWTDKSVIHLSYICEPDFVELKSGNLLGLFRYQRSLLPGDTPEKLKKLGGNFNTIGNRAFANLFVADSYDKGYIWKNFRPIYDKDCNPLLFWGDPHGTLIQLPDERILVVYDHRYERNEKGEAAGSEKTENRAVVSDDEGKTWGPEIYHVSFGKGYPSSVALEDGTIVTVTGNTPFKIGRGWSGQKWTAEVIRWKLLPKKKE